MRNPLRSMLTYVKKHRAMLIVSTLLRVTNLGLGIALLGLSGFLIAESITTGMPAETEYWITLGLVGLLKAIARYGEQITGHIAAFRILDTLRGELFDGFAGRETDSQSTERSGDLVSRAMADVELVEVFFAHTLAPVSAAICYLVAATIVVFTQFGITAAVLIAAILILAGIVVPVIFQRLGLAHGARTREQAGVLSAEIGETLAGMQDLISTGAYGRRVARVLETGRSYARETAVLTRQGALKSAIVDLLLMGSLLVLAWFGFYAGSTLSPSLVWAVIAGLAGGFGAILGVSRAVDDLPKSSAAATRILEMIRSPSGQPDVGTARPSFKTSHNDALQLTDVTYRYTTGGGVENLSLEIPRGSHLFVTGPSGSGKSTLAALLLKLISPQSGSIALPEGLASIDSEEAFRNAVSAAPQDPGLVRGSAEENVAFGLRLEADEAVGLPEASISIPDLESLYADLPDGSRTLIGGADEQISGGQKKRLSIARTVARDPSVVILDEAFAGLDSAIRTRIRSALLVWAKEAGRTVIELSHELSHGQDADRIVVLRDGRSVEEGTWTQLVDQKGFFCELLAAQTPDLAHAE